MLAAIVAFLSLAQASPRPAEEETPPRYGLSGDFDWSLSNARDSSLNLTHYGNDLTRLLRLTLAFNFRVSERAAVYVNLTSENASMPFLYGAFVRISPWGSEKFWLQAGKIPPPFGAFPERWYAAANPLIGYPLMYHNLTSLRPNSLPLNAADLLSQRGKGRASRFAGSGAASAGAGLPMISLLRWDSGAVGFGKSGRFEYVVGVTNGTLSNPQIIDENDGKQVLGRLRFRPHPAFEVGFSAARGPYLNRQVEDGLAGRDLESFQQEVVGLHGQLARDHFILHAEGAWSRWESPNIERPLDALSGFLEGRYRLLPGLYLAGRLDRMSFSEIDDGSGRREPWEYPLSRLELGAGYSWDRNMVLKLSLQANRYQGASALDENIVAVQIAVHF